MKIKQNTKTLISAFPYINKVLFNNELEQPYIQAVNMVEMLGMTVLYFGYKDEIGFSGLTVNSKGSQFVAVVKNNPYNTDFMNTFIHELIHVWQAQNNLPMNHGKLFKNKCLKAYEVFYT